VKLAQAEPGTGHAGNGVASRYADEVFVLPASIGQQSFWYLDQIQPGNPAYNIAVRFRLQGSLRVEELERALNEIVRRHEVLRTTFEVVDGVPAQIVAPHLFVPLVQDDLRINRGNHRLDRARAIAIEEANQLMDLAKGPLFRTRLVRVDESESVLIITVHHAVSDGWSIGLITQELGVVYDAYCGGLESPLPELSLQYGDYAIWQEEWFKGKDLAGQFSYWSRKLANLPVLEFPTDRPRAPRQTFPGSIESILLPRDLTDALVSLSKRSNATLFVVMLAAFKMLLQRHCSQNDVFVGTVLAGRPRVELEPLIGLFINPLVLRTDLSGDPPFVELLARVQQTVLQAFANQDLPFERVVDAAQQKRDPSRHPVFQINFLFQRDFVHSFESSGLTLTAIPSVSPGSIYDLNFFMVERAEGWRASCEYNTDLFDVSTIRRLLGEFQTLLEGVATDPAHRISQYPLAASKAPKLEPLQSVVGTAHAVMSDQSYVAPRDTIETQLQALWERVLGVKAISVTADFFDVGGHSLLAARLLAEIEKAFGKKLSIASLLQSPTIEAFADRLRMETSQQTNPPGRQAIRTIISPPEEKWISPEEQVFPIRGTGTRPPLYIVDAGPFQRPLVRHMGDDQPVFGIALPELSALPEKFTVAHIAANLVEALCQSGMDGPYHLAGWSQAGLIAYEVAQQLLKRGRDISLLVLFDTNNPTYLRSFKGWSKLPVRLYFKFEKYLYYLRKMRGMPFPDAWRYFREHTRKFQLHSPGKRLEDELPKDAPERLQMQSWRMQYLAGANYEPLPIDARIALFRSEALQTGMFRDPTLGWENLTHGGLRVNEMAGEHDTMFLEPDAQHTAAILNECLAWAQSATISPAADLVSTS
jgi:thioesterase domain-containing protein/acyl carrier protein